MGTSNKLVEKYVDGVDAYWQMKRKTKGIVDYWENVIATDKENGRFRLWAFLLNFDCGREYGESKEHYLDRTGMAEFYAWAIKKLGWGQC